MGERSYRFHGIRGHMNSQRVPAASANTPLTVTVTKILQNLTDNIGLDSTASIRVKVLSAQVWVTASGLQYPSLTADFYEINGNTANAASKIHSVGQRNA